MKLSVCCPVLNESFFIKLWFESVLKYADDIFIIDGGSTDGTIDIIESYKKADPRVRYISQPQSGNPYTNDWNENDVRNSLVAHAHGDYILMLDADEMLSDDFSKEGLGQFFYGFVFVPFWRDIETVRLSVHPDPRWYGNHLYRMFPRGMASYTKEKHHCRLVSNLPLAKLPTCIFHLHYAMESFNNKPKRGDNRRWATRIRIP
jgi:glycosyltransferase involved in cell wall biosynthesis